MTSYRKKPVVVEAFQMTRESALRPSDWPSWLVAARVRPEGENALWLEDSPEGDVFVCGTLEGAHDVTWGDFIIQGVRGEIYPCKPDIFAETYDEVAQ